MNDIFFSPLNLPFNNPQTIKHYIALNWTLIFWDHLICSTSIAMGNLKPAQTKVSTLSWRRPLSNRNQSIDLLSKWMDWFLYDNGLRHEAVNGKRNIFHSWNHSCFSLVWGNISCEITLKIFTIFLSNIIIW